MNEPFDRHRFERDEDARRAHAGDDRIEFAADLRAKELALQILHHVARCIVGAAFGRGADDAEPRPDALSCFRAAQGLRGGRRLFVRPGAELSRVVAAHHLRVVEFHHRHVGAVRENPLDRAVKEQIRIAADGRREMRVGVELKPEVTDVVGLIAGALHGSQNRRLNIGTVLRFLNHFRERIRARWTT